jgi:rare lipoprotein A
VTGRAAVLALVAVASLAGCVENEQAFPPPMAYPPQAAWAPPQAQWAPPSGWVPPPYQWGRASFYTDRLAGRRTATGEPYDPGAFTAAHRTLPLGTLVDVARTDGRHVTVRINDRGPYVDGRVIDLSRRAATEIGMIRDGVVDVVLRVMWVPPARRL